MGDLIKRDDALNACALREDNPPTEMQLSLRNVISALPAIDPAAIREAALRDAGYDTTLTDRIEELVKEREQWRRAAETRAKGWKISDDARIEAEAKLEKAVEGLKRICMQPDYRLPSPQEIARATLVGIKGESQDGMV